MIRMFASSAANVLSSKSSWSMNNRGGKKEKIKKRKTRGFFRFNVKTRTDLPSETKSALNFFRQMAAKMAESWSMLFFFHPLSFSYTLIRFTFLTVSGRSGNFSTRFDTIHPSPFHPWFILFCPLCSAIDVTLIRDTTRWYFSACGRPTTKWT